MPYRLVDGQRVWWPKYLDGRRPTKAASLAYWQARAEDTMAAKKKEPVSIKGWKPVPSDLNLWPPTKDPRKGLELVCLVKSVELGVKIGKGGQTSTRIKVLEPDGTLWTLKAHKVLIGRVENTPIGLKPFLTALRITYDGREKGDQPQPMEMYSVEYDSRVENPALMELFSAVVPAEQTF